jgi:hypothetical protein
MLVLLWQGCNVGQCNDYGIINMKMMCILYNRFNKQYVVTVAIPEVKFSAYLLLSIYIKSKACLYVCMSVVGQRWRILFGPFWGPLAADNEKYELPGTFFRGKNSRSVKFRYNPNCKRVKLLRATGWTAGVGFPVGPRCFSSPQRPDRVCGPPSLLSSEYWELYLGGWKPLQITIIFI